MTPSDPLFDPFRAQTDDSPSVEAQLIAAAAMYEVGMTAEAEALASKAGASLALCSNILTGVAVLGGWLLHTASGTARATARGYAAVTALLSCGEAFEFWAAGRADDLDMDLDVDPPPTKEASAALALALDMLVIGAQNASVNEAHPPTEREHARQAAELLEVRSEILARFAFTFFG